MNDPVSWQKVLDCFADRSNPLGVIQRLGAEWAGRFDLPAPKFGPHMPVFRETWDMERVKIHLDVQARIVPEMRTDEKPRRMDGPLVLVDFGNGRVGQIDGRRRINLWQHIPGEYEVLRICAF